jgi:hypothetical protein
MNKRNNASLVITIIYWIYAGKSYIANLEKQDGSSENEGRNRTAGK